MANRTGTYVAFDGLGTVDPTASDFKYYAMLQAWSKNPNFDFSLVNSHEKTYAVRDDSLDATLKARIQERLRASKHILVILSHVTRKQGSMLSFEIEYAADVYKLPFIITYPGYSHILHVDWYSNLWPYSLASRIRSNSVKAIHIPFNQNAISDALARFSVNAEYPNTSMSYYTRDAHKSFGIEV